MAIRRAYIFLLFINFVNSRYFLNIDENYCVLEFKNEYDTFSGVFTPKADGTLTLKLIDSISEINNDKYSLIRDRTYADVYYIKSSTNRYEYIAESKGCPISFRKIDYNSKINIFYKDDCGVDQNNVPTVNLLDTIKVTTYDGKEALVQNNVIEFYINYFDKYDAIYLRYVEPFTGYKKLTLFDDTPYYFDGMVTYEYYYFGGNYSTEHKAFISKSTKGRYEACKIVYLNISARNNLPLYTNFIEEQEKLEKENREEEERKRKESEGKIRWLIIIAIIIGALLFLCFLVYIGYCCGCCSSSSSSSNSGKGIFGIFVVHKSTTISVKN